MKDDSIIHESSIQGSELVFQVSEFNEMINNHLSLLGEVTVEGEIGSISQSRNRFLYITLKDDNSVLHTFSMLHGISGWRVLEEGMRVQVIGSAGIYAPYGKFTLNVHTITPVGEGSLKLAFQKLKAQLEKEGLFDPARKRKLNPFPQKIGLLTAKGSQAYNDFVKILNERMGGLTILFYPIHVQGKESVASIVKAINDLNSVKLDAVILIRGGGSLEDLQSFNDEQVARAVFSSRNPVMCGVGHEGDWSLVDEIADVRASTPSNAAELLVRDRRSVLKDVDFLVRHMISGVEKKCEKSHAVINTFLSIARNSQRSIRNKRNEVDMHAETCIKGAFRVVESSKDKLSHYERLFRSFDFDSVLKRGFSITRTDSGKILKSVEMIKSGHHIVTQLHRGTITSEVSIVSKNEKNIS